MYSNAIKKESGGEQVAWKPLTSFMKTKFHALIQPPYPAFHHMFSTSKPQSLTRAPDLCSDCWIPRSLPFFSPSSWTYPSPPPQAFAHPAKAHVAAPAADQTLHQLEIPLLHLADESLQSTGDLDELVVSLGGFAPRKKSKRPFCKAKHKKSP